MHPLQGCKQNAGECKVNFLFRFHRTELCKPKTIFGLHCIEISLHRTEECKPSAEERKVNLVFGLHRSQVHKRKMGFGFGCAGGCKVFIIDELPISILYCAIFKNRKQMLYIYLSLVFIGAIILYFKSKGLYKGNEIILDKLKQLSDKQYSKFDAVWVKYSLNSLVFSSTLMKVYVLEKEIILIGEYDLDLNPDNEKRAATCCLFKKNTLNYIPAHNFKNFGEIENLQISKKGNIIISTFLNQKSMWKKISFYPQDSYKTEISISLPIEKNETYSILQLRKLV